MEKLTIVTNGPEHGANDLVAGLTAIRRVVKLHYDADIGHNFPWNSPIFPQKHAVARGSPKTYRNLLAVRWGSPLAGADARQQFLQRIALQTGPPVGIDGLQKRLQLSQFPLQQLQNRLHQ